MLTMHRLSIVAATCAVALTPAALADAKTKPKSTVKCAVPNLVGDTLAQAKTRLVKAHCKAGTINTPIGSTGWPEIVSSQSPKTGKRAKGALITIWMKVKPVSPVSIGSTQTTYDINGNPLQVTVTSISDPATGATEYDTPVTPGDRFVAVQLALTNPGPGTVSDDANSDTAIIGSDDQAYTAGFSSIAGCTNFTYGQFTLSPGATLDGCVEFELPPGVTTQQVQFTLGDNAVDFNAS